MRVTLAALPLDVLTPPGTSRAVYRARSRMRGGAVVVILTLVGLLPVSGQQGASAAQPTTECSGNLTPALTEGPYYKAGSPERASLLEQGTPGTKLVVTGYVFGRNCQPIPGAWLDFWQTDGNGDYDNAGYKMRGHQFADRSGRYRLETVVPGEYPGRTPHIHVKVRAPDGPTLTSQLFMPDVARNNTDSIFNRALVMSVQDTADGKSGNFNFVLNVDAPQPPGPPAGTGSYTFSETGLTVSGDFWTVWLGGRSFEDSLYINGLPISGARDEVSPTDGKTYKTQWFERARFEMHPENRPPSNVLLGLLGVTAAQGRQNEAAFRPVNNPGGGLQWFAETRQTVGDSSEGGRAIAAFWTRLGGLQQFGYPLSQPFMEVSKDDGKSYLVQYFERQRFEYHPENRGTRFEVLLGRLGAEQIKR
jgi:protocatechuate 3,4-dioxygenase beta subunit